MAAVFFDIRNRSSAAATIPVVGHRQRDAVPENAALTDGCRFRTTVQVRYC